MTKVLVVNEFSGLSTGYSVYGRELLKRLYKKFDVAELATYVSEHEAYGLGIPPWKVYFNSPSKDSPEISSYKSNLTNEFGEFKFHQVCLDFKPDTVIAFRDNWMDSFIDSSPFRNYFNFIWMPTADGTPLNEEWMDTYKRADILLTYSDWSKQLIENQSGNEIKVLSSASPAASHEFKQLDKLALKKQFDLNSMIIGTVMRNQKRKLFPALFEGFRKFLDITNKDALLYCHTSYPDLLGWDLPKLLLYNGLSSKVIFTYVCRACKNWFPALFNDVITGCPRCGNLSAALSSVKHGVDNTQLAQIYNLMDLYVQYSCCEGFGVPLIEAAACGVPVAAINYSAPEDILNKLNGIKLRPKYLQDEVETGRKVAVPDIDNLVDELVTFAALPLGIRMAKGNRTRKLYEQNYNWDKVAQIWSDAINSVPSRNGWNTPKRIIEIPQDYPKNLSNSKFVDWLILNVLQDPSKLGVYFASRLLKQLNYGVINSHMLPSLMDENSVFFHVPPIEFTQKEAYQYCVNMVIKYNHWESQR